MYNPEPVEKLRNNLSPSMKYLIKVVNPKDIEITPKEKFMGIKLLNKKWLAQSFKEDYDHGADSYSCQQLFIAVQIAEKMLMTTF